MNFSEALKAMKMGSKVSREAWRGKISCIYRKGELFIQEYPDGNEWLKPCFTVNDILAEDWWIVT